MKEKLKDRIDVLLEKAKAGDSKAQLELAKSFYKGHLVEKSIDQAKYWAFRAMSDGNSSASECYHAIVQGKRCSNNNVVDLCEKISFFPILEFAITFIPLLIMGIFKLDDNIFYDVCFWIFVVGVISFFISLVFGKIGESINNLKGKSVGATVGFIIVHIVAFCLTYA